MTPNILRPLNNQYRRFFKMYKIWIAGQVAGRGELKNIQELVDVSYPYVDGFCWCVNYQNDDFSDNDGTYGFLEHRKKEGRIVRANWVNINSLGMTMAIQSGRIKHGDWVLILDAQEEPKLEFLESLRKNTDEWTKAKVGAVCWGRPYYVRFNMDMVFAPQSVHCTIQPIQGNTISIVDESKVRYDDGGCHFGDFIYNKKNLDNSTILHGVKYSLFNRSNQFEMFYGHLGEKVYRDHEIRRRQFLLYLQATGYENTLDGLEKFLRKTDFTDEEISYIDYEFIWKDFYRFKILGQTRQEILANRMQWSFKRYLETNEKEQILCLTK